MPESVRRYFPIPIPIFVRLVLVSIAIVPGRAQQSGTKSQSAARSKTYERPTGPPLYVGSEAYKTCHEDLPSKGFYKTYEDSPHYVPTPDTEKGPEWHGSDYKNAALYKQKCATCHGADGIFKLTTL
jgi:mono/diheme cytochrome c family protein